jgi:hypothetical protein
MHRDLISIRHNEIVAGKLDLTVRLKAIVKYALDIPFCFDPSLSDPESGPVKLLEGGIGGSCTPKHYALAYLLQEEGKWRNSQGFPELRVQYLTFPFRFHRVMRFDGFKIEFPAHILMECIPEGHHSALGVYVGEVGRELLVDVTWDPPLAAAGFPVAASWDGRTDMALAVPYGGEKFTAATIDKKLKHLEYLSSRPQRYRGECQTMEELTHILQAANRWFESIRSRGDQ